MCKILYSMFLYGQFMCHLHIKVIVAGHNDLPEKALQFISLFDLLSMPLVIKYKTYIVPVSDYKMINMFNISELGKELATS